MNGSFVEQQIADYLCEKRYGELNRHWQMLLKMMFDDISDRDYIYCENVCRQIKQDIFITSVGRKKTISIKSGNTVSVHCESLDSFCNYLSRIGISDYGINTLRLYHYGDGTIDGTGKTRDLVEKVKEIYADRIKLFNEEVNKVKILSQIIDRFLNTGTVNQKDHVDYLYFGNLFSGELYDMKDLIDFLTIKHCLNISSIHFGPFYYCPFYRGITAKQDKELDRHYCIIKWFGHEIDLNKFVKYRKKLNINRKHISSSIEYKELCSIE